MVVCLYWKKRKKRYWLFYKDWTCPIVALYCGKDEDGNRTYKSKQYLLWTFREIVEKFNNEHNDKIAYAVQQTVKSTKYIVKIADTPEDDCRCERCENAELLLMGIK